MRAICLISVLLCTGCQSVLHEMKPHRLWRWNYYEPTSREAFGTFSIDDPLLQSVSTVQRDQTSTEQAKVEAPIPTVR